MAKVIPTTKSCSQILGLICGAGYSGFGNRMYVQTTFDPTSTHALYGVTRNEADSYVSKIKSIGGKYIRVVKGRREMNNPYVVICFALAITPAEQLKVKMELEENERRQQAFDSKLTEIKLSPMLIAVGATNEKAQMQFARRLLYGDLDPLLPFESYVVFEPPRDKDEKRIIDIINKANAGFANCVGMCTTSNAGIRMRDLAERMNRSITDEDKRARRRAACLHYGLKFLAECFK